MCVRTCWVLGQVLFPAFSHFWIEALSYVCKLARNDQRIKKPKSQKFTRKSKLIINPVDQIPKSSSKSKKYLLKPDEKSHEGVGRLQMVSVIESFGIKS